MKPIILTTCVATSVVAGLVAVAPAAAADSGRPGVTATGSCSARSDWELKAKNDDGRIEVEFEVDSNVVGQLWNVRITDNGTVLVRRSFRTTAPSGSFSVERKVPNRAGADRFVARATNPVTGETCVGRVSLG